MQPRRALTSGLGVPPLLLAWWVGLVAPVRPTHGVLVLSCPFGTLRVHVRAVSWATWLLFTGVPARCAALRVRVLGHLAPVHRCTRSGCCLASAVSWATWLLFTGVPAVCLASSVRCSAPLGSCSSVRPLGVLLCLCGVLGHFAPVHRWARSVCCVVCAVSRATWLLFTGVRARCVVLRAPCPGPLGSCPPVCVFGVLCCARGVLGHLAPVHQCLRAVCCVASDVFMATCLLFTGVPARCVVLLVRCPGPIGSCSPLRPLLACFACAVSWATSPLFSGVPARCAVLCVRCTRPLGTCTLVCVPSLLWCLCGVLGHLAPDHWCPRSTCCVARAVSWATWLLFTGVPVGCVVSRVRGPGPLGSCSPPCPLSVLCCVCGFLGPFAPDHRCSRSVRCFACAVS